MRVLFAAGFDVLTSVGCVLGIFFPGWGEITAWVCIGLILIKTVLFGLTGPGGNVVVSLLLEFLISIGIPAAVGFGLGIGVWHMSLIKCIFLTGAFHCAIGWVVTVFNLK